MTQRNPEKPILLVDDERPWLRSLTLSLREAAQYDHFLTCTDSRQVLPLLKTQEVSLILLDLTMPHLSGEDLLPLILKEQKDLPIIILSGMNQVETAVRCMRHGAFDYHVKTVEITRLITAIERALAMRSLQLENRRLKDRFLAENLERPEDFESIHTRSARMQSIFRYIEAVAPGSEPILITGESGVGKELVARAIHRVSRSGCPFVALNAAGLDDNVFSDTLFGHLRGAFTGADQTRPGMIEKAGDGILFLDEIGDLSPASQIKLLRLLQEGEYYPLGGDTPRRNRARLVMATNVDLADSQATGAFRKDLYFRLSAHRIHLPPLRERKEDLPLLLEVFLEEASRDLHRRKPAVPPELLTLLGTYRFPGNIRELRAMVFHAVSAHQGHILALAPFREAMGLGGEKTPGEDPAAAVHFTGPLPSLEEAGNLLVNEALRRSDGNRSIAASLLGISRQALSKRLKKKAD